MPGFAHFLLRAAVVAGLLLTAGTSALLAQERVGVNSAVNPEATGALPGAPARRLVIGQDVIFNEHITTAASGQTQLLFLDESSMSIGPNSDLTIDQFVYDPKTGTGKLAMSATRGLLRYVGGKLSKQDDAVTLRTATATLAVRGGAFIAQIAPNGTTDAAFLYGKGLTITGVAGGSETLKRPGFHSMIIPGGGPSPPALLPPGLLAQFTQQLDGRSGSTGGAASIPTDTSVADSGISQTISGNVAQSTQQAAQNQGATQSTFQPNLTAPTTVTSTEQSATTQAGVAITTTSTGSFAGVSKTGGGSDLPDQTSSSNVKFKNGTLSKGTFSATVGGSLLSFPLATGTSTFSATGSSPGGALSGTSFLSNDGAYFYANLTAANGLSFFVSGGQAVPSSVLASTGATRIFAFNVSAAPSQNPSLAPPVYLVAPASTAIGDTTTASAARTLHGSVAFSGQGSAQTSRVDMITGTVGTLQSSGAPIITSVLRAGISGSGSALATITSAVGSVVDANGNSIYGTNTITGFTLDQTQFAPTANGTVGNPLASNATNTEAVALSPSFQTFGFAQPAVATTLPSGVGTNRTTQTLTGFFGGTMTTTATSAPYAITGTASIATDSVANTVNATFTSDTSLTSSATGGVTAVTMNFGGKQSAFIDDNIFGAAEDPATPQQINGQQLTKGGDTSQASQLYLVSSTTGALPTSLLPSGVSFCQCQYLQWGYWGGSLLTGNASNDFLSRVDHGHINFWVAGVPTVTMPTTGIGTYNGAAIGSVFTNGSNYVAAGGFSGTYNFGTQSTTFAVNNFDGHTFAAVGPASRTGANYTFGVSGSGLTGTMNGTFYGPGAAETGGNFSVQAAAGATYLASPRFPALPAHLTQSWAPKLRLSLPRNQR